MDEETLEQDLERLLAAAAAAQLSLKRRKITTELNLPRHEQPPNLPYGKVAIFAFFRAAQCLKCGKAEKNSASHYTSQQYNARSPGLARSLINSGERIGVTLETSTAGVWMKENTTRVNLLFPASAVDYFVFRRGRITPVEG